MFGEAFVETWNNWKIEVRMGILKNQWFFIASCGNGLPLNNQVQATNRVEAMNKVKEILGKKG